MMTAQRQRGRRRAVATVAAIAATTGLIAGVAAPAGAATAEFIDQAPGESGNPHGTAHDVTGNWAGGLFDITIDGDTPGQAYCIDIATDIIGDPTYEEVDWASSGIDNLETVEAILRHYYPNGDGPDAFPLVGSDADKAMGTQAAIWHFTDGFELTDDTTENSADVIANYETILAAIASPEGLDGFGEPTVTLGITPPASTEGEVGGVVGPYVVDTTADTVTVTTSDGVTLVDSEGAPFTDEIVDGTEFWLSSDAAGAGSVSATASATATAGRVFLADSQQSLILAAPVTVEAAADAVVSFVSTPPTTEPEPTTTTTAPETTTTTVPITPDTSVVPPPSTTVPVTPSGGGLPVTGAQSLILAAVALLLVALGVGFRIVSRRAESGG